MSFFCSIWSKILNCSRGSINLLTPSNSKLSCSCLSGLTLERLVNLWSRHIYQNECWPSIDYLIHLAESAPKWTTQKAAKVGLDRMSLLKKQNSWQRDQTVNNLSKTKHLWLNTLGLKQDFPTDDLYTKCWGILRHIVKMSYAFLRTIFSWL